LKKGQFTNKIKENGRNSGTQIRFMRIERGGERLLTTSGMVKGGGKKKIKKPSWDRVR